MSYIHSHATHMPSGPLSSHSDVPIKQYICLLSHCSPQLRYHILSVADIRMSVSFSFALLMIPMLKEIQGKTCHVGCGMFPWVSPSVSFYFQFKWSCASVFAQVVLLNQIALDGQPDRKMVALTIFHLHKLCAISLWHL